MVDLGIAHPSSASQAAWMSATHIDAAARSRTSRTMAATVLVERAGGEAEGQVFSAAFSRLIRAGWANSLGSEGFESVPLSSIASIYRESRGNQSVRYEPRPGRAISCWEACAPIPGFWRGRRRITSASRRLG